VTNVVQPNLFPSADTPNPATRLLTGLNPAQQQAVQLVHGPVLIIAGPGSGKTRVLTHRIAYLIDVAGVDPYRICAVTFTNKAAKEMRHRLEGLVAPEAVARLTVGTFHALGVRILRQDADKLGYERDFAIYDDEDQLGVVKAALKDLNLDDKQNAPRAMLSLISKAKSALLDPAEFRAQAENYREEIASRVYARYQEALIRNRAMDFDDLIRLPIKLWTEDPAARERWQRRFEHILVDEYQDTNHAQYIMVKMLADKSRNLCVVGDPDQSIYGWRQADIQNILNFERDYPEAQVVLLEQNYRSTQMILDTAQHVIAPNTERKEKRLWTENAGGLPVTIYEAYNEDDEASYTAREISRMVKSGKVRWRDCAVMYRMNAQSRAIEQAFLGYNVPYQVVGGVRFYSRKEIKDVLALLRLTLNPFDSVSLIRAVNNTPVGRGIGAKTLADLERTAGLRGVPLYAELQLLINGEEEEPGLSRQAANKLHPLLELIDSFIAMRDQVNLLELLDRILERTRYGEFLKDGTDEGDERWNNVLEIRSVAGNYNELTPPEGLSRFLEDVALISDIDTIQEEKDAVTLITLHAAKGLEFPVVFMIGLEEGLLPHSRALDSLHELEEERRLAYVGITRAKQHLYLIYAFKRTFYGETRISTPSRFIHDIPPHLAKGLERAKATSRMTGGQGAGGGVRYSSDSEPTGRVFGASGRSPSGSGSSSRREPPTRTPPPAPCTPSRPSNPPPPTPNPPAPRYKAGDKVRHALFGEGIVVMTKATGGDEEVTVAFAGQGVKRLLASMAHLERL
jgi:DNA helicase-2/ATP-dependent DNA helicase PcrA